VHAPIVFGIEQRLILASYKWEYSDLMMAVRIAGRAALPASLKDGK